MLCADDAVVGPLRAGKVEGRAPRCPPGKHFGDCGLLRREQVDRESAILLDRLDGRAASVDTHENHRGICGNGGNSADGDAKAPVGPIRSHYGHGRCYTAHRADEGVWEGWRFRGVGQMAMMRSSAGRSPVFLLRFPCASTSLCFNDMLYVKRSRRKEEYSSPIGRRSALRMRRRKQKIGSPGSRSSICAIAGDAGAALMI